MVCSAVIDGLRLLLYALRARVREGNFSSQKNIILQLWPAKLRHTKPTCNDMVNKIFQVFPILDALTTGRFYEQTVTQQNNIP